MRGKARSLLTYSAICGITPAHAGKRRPAAVSLYAFRDHPRACGEKRNLRGGWSVGEGSPPRMRGKVAYAIASAISCRITPAHAGKRCPDGVCCPGAGDHPRACGEKSGRAFSRRAYQGSPPRMRGKVVIGRSAWQMVRITPAHAGKSPSSCFS